MADPKRQAELDEIDRKRREKEALLLLFLLGVYGYSRSLVNASIRTGHDEPPQIAAALRRGLLGDGTRRFPGVSPRLAAGLADIDLSARQAVARQATAAGIDAAAVAEVSAATKAELIGIYKPFAEHTAEEMADNLTALVNDIIARADASAVHQSITDVITTMREAWAAKGYSPTNFVGAQAQAITLAAKAWSAGSYAGFRTPGVWQQIQGFEYVTVRDSDGQPDNRVCPVCYPRNGVKLPRDDPWWLSNWPGLHWRCRCVVFVCWLPFTPKHPPDDLLPPGKGFGLRPDQGPGFSAFGTA